MLHCLENLSLRMDALLRNESLSIREIVVHEVKVELLEHHLSFAAITIRVLTANTTQVMTSADR